MTTRTRVRTAFGVVFSLVVALAAGIVMTPSAAARGGPPVPSLDWQPCGADYPGRLCATARVPLDYDEPRGRTTELALAKVPASDPARRIGTLFINPGVIGLPGVEFLHAEGDTFAENLDGRFDVVVFDPRGVAGSDPLHCFDSEEDLGAFLGSQPVFPYRRTQERPYFDHWRSLGPECLDDRQVVARQMSSADVARDMDLLRQAVGDSRLSYLGYTYGSHIGNTYANLFPGRVRALVLDGVPNPELWTSGWLVEYDRRFADEVFAEGLRLCDAAGPACAFGAPGGSQARWQALSDRIRREPYVHPDYTYTYDLLIADASVTMAAPELLPAWMAWFDGVADAVLSDQPARTLKATRNSVPKQLETPSPEADYPNGFDANNAIFCSDAEYPSRFGTYRAVAKWAASGSQIAPRWWWSIAGCANWPAAPDRYAGPWNAQTSAPVLLVGNYHNPFTYYAGAQASAKLLPSSRLLSYAGWGAESYPNSDCIQAHVNRYLLTGALPPKGTVCPAGPNPFTTAVQRRSAPEMLLGLPPVRESLRGAR